MSGQQEPEYPDWRHAAEARRLEIQGRLVTEALGGSALLCPLDLSRPGLRILDSATANGSFLFALRQQLGSPETAELVGTDIAPFADTLGLPANIQLRTQDVLAAWPAHWAGTFDLVHQRNALSVTGTPDRAVAAMRRMVLLAKPGGWVQFVDGAMPDGAIERDDADPPATIMFKTMRHCLARLGINTRLGAATAELLQRAGEGLLRDVGSRTGVSVCGKGAATKELEEMGYEQLDGLCSATAALLEGTPEEERPLSMEELKSLLPAVMAQARESGVDMTWYAAWGQRI
jgi:gliotoxin biosynthesis N-methyltransferase